MFHSRLIADLLAGVMALLVVTVLPARPAFAELPADHHPDAVRVEHFNTLPFRETPFEDLAGLHRISGDAARHRNHYRFEYDADDRLVRVSFRLGDRLRDLNNSANYYFEAPRIDIRYEDGVERRRYFDRHGNPVAVHGTVFEAVFERGPRGYRRSLRYLDVHGQPTQTNWGVGLYTWQILPDGTVHEHREGLDGSAAPLRRGFPFFDIRLHYGPNGFLALMQNFGAGDGVTMNALNAAQDRLEYDANGDMRAWNVLDAAGDRSVGNGPGVARGLLTYDVHGLQIAQSHEDADGDRMVSAYGWGVTRSDHDAFGNTVRRSNHAIDDERPVDNPLTGYSAYTYRYAENGFDLLELSLFAADGRPVGHPRAGYATRRQSHDENGNVLTETHFGPEGRPILRHDSGAFERRHRYDARNRRVETRLFGRHGEPIDHARDGWHRETVSYVGDTAVIDQRRYWAGNGNEVTP